MLNLVKKSAKCGNNLYYSKSFKRSFYKIEVIDIQELSDGKLLNLPTVDVIKSAKRKIKDAILPNIFE